MSGVWVVDNIAHVWIPPGRAPSGYTPQLMEYEGLQIVYHTTAGVPPVVQELAKTHTWIAHNAEQFDAPAWTRLYPDVRPAFCDTLHLCRLHGWPGSLDAASKAMGGAGKSPSDAMKLLTEAKVRNGRVCYLPGTGILWDNLIRYNLVDVLELRRIANEVVWIERYNETRILTAHSIINQTGIYIDVPFARKLRDCWEQCKQESVDRINELTGGRLNGTNIRSVKQVKQYLHELGFTDLDSLNQAVVNQILNDPESYIDEHSEGSANDSRLAVAILAERQNANRATIGKLDRVFTVLDADSSVRNVIQYHGAGTGRFSGRDLQPHNFPRGYSFGSPTDLPELLDNLSYDSVRKVAEGARHPNIHRSLTAAEVLATLTRCIIRPRAGNKFAIVDYTAIEGRGVAWIARCNRALDIFRNPKGDIYCDMATSLYGRPITKHNKEERFIGKQIVLGCGYGMGYAKFDLMCKVFLVDLVKVGVTAEQCVSKYRETYPEIAQVWRDIHTALMYAVSKPGATAVAGMSMFQMRNGFLEITLPSGRKLKYRRARIVHLPPKWEPTGKPIPQVMYDTPFGFSKILYGGLVTENIVQAISRDILCAGLVELVPRYACPLHVHDEGVYEALAARAELALAEIGGAMIRVPEWATGFPIGCEGFTSPVYTKTPLPGEKEQKFLAS